MSRTSSKVEINVKAVIRTLLLTDLVDSTKLVGQLGDQRSAEVFATHDRIARDLLDRYSGREIDKTDGFLFLFERPIDALRYALAYHHELSRLSEELEVPLSARAGIHLGEVILRENPPEDVARGAKPLEVEGYTKPTAARLMSLANGRQTLISRIAFDLARRALRGSDDFPESAKWLAHGPYIFKGVDESLEVCEVGIDGFSPLEPPPGSEKARRAVAPGDEITLGWRPAKGQEIPNRKNWLLEDKLGEGGFGEVWLAARGAEKRVFKFCFHSDRLRALKREVVLFRLLQETLGQREDIASIIDWQFEEPPYFIESQYTRGGNLIDWAVERGGVRNIAESVRLDVVAQVADALAAAHSVGVLHKDIKPSNILIYTDNEQRSRARLTDFGIGLITDKSILEARGITATGLTETSIGSAGTSSNSGTRIYMAPELLEGKPATVQSDIYALGVMLYQMMVGDLRRALAPGWERNIVGEVLREDLAACIDGDPKNRISSASELAERLRTVRERQQQREAERREKEEQRRAQQFMERSRKRRKFLITAFGGVTVIGLLLIVLSIYSIQQARIAEAQRLKAVEAGDALQEKSDELALALKDAEDQAAIAKRELYFSQILLASSYVNQRRYDFAEDALWKAPEDLRDIEWGFLLWQTNLDLQTLRGHSGAVLSAEFSGIEGASVRLLTASRDRTARVWEPRSGEELFSLSSSDAPADGVDAEMDSAMYLLGRGYSAIYSPDGKMVATAFPGSGNIIRIWSVTNDQPKLLHEMEGHTDLVTHIEFSKDGEALLSASLDGTAQLWDVKRGAQAGSYRHAAGEVPVLYATMSNNGRFVATCGRDGVVRVWKSRLHMGKADAEFADHGGPVYYATFNQGDDMLFTASIYGANETAGAEPTGRGRLWGMPGARSASGKQLLHEFNDELELLAKPVFNESSNDLLLAARQGIRRKPVAVLYECSRWSGTKQKMVFEGHEGAVLDVAFSPAPPNSAAKNSNLIIATSSADRTVRLWDPATGAEQIVLSGHSGAVTDIDFSTRGFLIASASLDGSARLWDSMTRPEVGAYVGASRDIESGSINPSGTRIALGYASGRAEVHTVGPEGTLDPLRGFDGPVHDVRWLNDEDVLTLGYNTSTNESEIRVSQPGAQDNEKPITIEGEMLAMDIVMSDKSNTIIVGGKEGIAVLLALETPNKRTALEGTDSDILAVALAPELDYAATGGRDSVIRVYDLSSGQLRSEIAGHEGFVTALCFDPRPGYLVSGSTDRTIRLWDFISGNESILEGHDQRISFLGHSPDGTRLLSASDDRTFKIWELQKNSERELFSFTRGNGPISALQFTEDNERLLAVSRGDMARVFQLVPPVSGNKALRTDTFQKWHQKRSGERIAEIETRATDSRYLAFDILKQQSPESVPSVFSAMQDAASFVDTEKIRGWVPSIESLTSGAATTPQQTPLEQAE